MDKERSADILIGGTGYTLMLTTKATKEIAKRYGGLDKLGDKLTNHENMEQALDEIVWLVTLLANQGIQVENLTDPIHCRELLTEDMVEILTTPVELATYKDAIMEAMYKGTKRNIVSETDPKNEQVG